MKRLTITFASLALFALGACNQEAATNDAEAVDANEAAADVNATAAGETDLNAVDGKPTAEEAGNAAAAAGDKPTADDTVDAAAAVDKPTE